MGCSSVGFAGSLANTSCRRRRCCDVDGTVFVAGAGKFVPESAVREMKANFSLPSDTDQFVDRIIWVELGREKTQALVDM